MAAGIMPKLIGMNFFQKVVRLKYSIIIPAHNEGDNIGPFLTRFIEDLPGSLSDVLLEIILVENGSKDNTLSACKGLEEKYPNLIRVLSLERGSYGEAIKRGMLESCGTHLSILECDFLDAEFIVQSIELFKLERSNFIIASKRHRDAVDDRPLKRRLLTLGFNLFLTAFFRYPGTDTHGLKSIQSDLAKKLCALAETTDEIFQTEIVLIAWKLGEKIQELPIRVKEERPVVVSISRRVPKVMNILVALHKSLKRFQ